jgi:hypothetical protein
MVLKAADTIRDCVQPTFKHRIDFLLVNSLIRDLLFQNRDPLQQILLPAFANSDSLFQPRYAAGIPLILRQGLPLCLVQHVPMHHFLLFIASIKIS